MGVKNYWQTRHANFTPQKFNILHIMKDALGIKQSFSLVINVTTSETINRYQKLQHNPELKYTWNTAFGKEFGSLVQGNNKTDVVGTNSIYVMEPQDILKIPKDRTFSYGCIFIDYREQNADPNRVRITMGGNLINYPGKWTTKTSDLTTSKILWTSVLSTDGAQLMCIDINFFLPMCPNGYIKVHANAPQGVSPAHHWPIQPEWKREKWFHLFVNLTQHIWLASSRPPCKQVPQEETLPIRILWSTPHPRHMKTHLTSRRIQPCCRYFWHQLFW